MRLGFTPVGGSSLGALVIPFALAASSACAGAPDTEPATHDDFRAIQRHEARADAALDRARDPTLACADRCGATGAVCEAARMICRIARDTADLDARARCRHAQDACREARRAPRRPPDPCNCSEPMVSARRAASTVSRPRG